MPNIVYFLYFFEDFFIIKTKRSYWSTIFLFTMPLNGKKSHLFLKEGEQREDMQIKSSPEASNIFFQLAISSDNTVCILTMHGTEKFFIDFKIIATLTVCMLTVCILIVQDTRKNFY